MASPPLSIPLLPFLLIVVVAVAVAVFTPLQASLLDDDQQALLQIKLSLSPLNGSISSALADWAAPSSNDSSAANSSTNVCSWSRVACSSVANSTRVTGLDLSSLSLSGELPSQAFSLLSSLSTLNLSRNSIHGPISQDIANCTHLTSLDLSFNNLSSLPNSSLAPLSALQSLNLSSNSISATLSQAIPGNCHALQFLNVSTNSFTELSSVTWQNCTNLQMLDLSQNLFAGSNLPTNLASLPSLQRLVVTGKMLSGPMPSSLCAGDALEYLDLSGNNLTGSFPLFLTNCSSLLHLDISSNNLTGDLPSEIGDMVAIQAIDISENLFHGSLPAGLGNLSTLEVFMAGSNGFTGIIPSEISQCKSLRLLDLDTNALSGDLPDFLDEMPSLQYLVLHSNQFAGSIPASLFNVSGLRFLDLSNNNISGTVSPQFMNLSSLQFLLLADNQINGQLPSELGALSDLVFLDLSSNRLEGSIPPSLGNLKSLLWLMLAYNDLTGAIPPQLGNSTSLLWLNLRNNSLSGELPSELATMGQDPQAAFDLNARTINPPQALGECLMIKRWVPENFRPYSFMYDILDTQRCKSLWIDLLTGTPLLFSCGGLPGSGGYIQVSDNRLTGNLPSSLQGNKISVLLLSGNLFTGSLPDGFSDLPLRYFNASRNSLSGPIPSSFGQIKCLALLDLSYNNLSGPIPTSLNNLSQLSSFNVSYNPLLSGPVPSSAQFATFSASSYNGDPLLCFDTLVGARTGNTSNSSVTLPSCSSSLNSTTQDNAQSEDPAVAILKTTLLVTGVVAGLMVVLGAAFGFCMIRKRALNLQLREFRDPQDDMFSYSDKLDVDASNSQSGGIYSATRMFRYGDARPASESSMKRLTYADILLATNNFDEQNVLGSGGFGVVYKAKLPDGSTVAVKKLVQHGAQGEREFLAEMETLGSIEHENLVPLLGVCVFGAEKLLIYKFLSNGSLEDWLHEREGGAETLTWARRLKIACHCARALSYLHHECNPVLVHRDMKASNVLLDEEFNGYLADFGLAREIDEGYTHVSTVVAGTLGYVPPEYCQTWKATTKGDVYSFGVVMLELITGRQPISSVSFTAPSENCSGSDEELLRFRDDSLVGWVRTLSKASRTEEAYHPVVKQTAAGRKQELLLFMELAQACTRDAPERRPSMEAVAKRLEAWCTV